MKWEFSSNDDTEDEAVVVARVFRAVPAADDPSPRINLAKGGERDVLCEH